ncbi:hypothetical protein BGX23_008384 [Mortierella sp. AD031]|nr:hypothetical protein BGX23_008384 [Mortierella sp. AD031]
MSTPVQVDAPFLDKLICLGPSASQDIRVYGDDGINDADKTHSAPGLTTLSSTSTDTPSQGNQSEIKKGFQPQRKYYLEGRIIHKRKLSRRLFFLDISLVRRKSELSNEIATSREGVKGPVAADKEDITGSDWEDIGARVPAAEMETDVKLHGTRPQRRMEVIARFPTHTLKELDDLWRRVQLGAVIRVFGDIEISEKKKPSSEEQQEQEQQAMRWSALLHCLDFEVLEVWRGKDAFEPNPGSAEISNGSGQEGGVKSSERKRKSSEISGDSFASPRPEKQQQRGDDSQPHCKFWLNSGKCSKELCLFWHETDPVKLKAERRRWVDDRIQAKRQISHHASDPHQKTTKNQHRERALYFAQWLINTFTSEFLNSGSGVLDIAGGRGDLSWELQTRQGIRSTVVEPRPGKGMRKWQRKWLDKFKANNCSSDAGSEVSRIQDKADIGTASTTTTDATEEQEPDADKDLDGLADFIPTVKTQPLQATEPSRIQAMLDDQFLTTHHDLVGTASIMIGLHPDQATEPIVRASLKAGKPFAIIPCCVFGRDNPHRRLPKVLGAGPDMPLDSGRGAEEEEDASTRPVTSYDDFVTWLTILHPDIKTTWLNFEGMNRVLYWEGPSRS